MRGRKKALLCEFLFFGGTWIVGVWGEVGQKFYLGPDEIASFSSRDFRRSDKHDKFWHVVSTVFLRFVSWTIAFSDFRPFKIDKNLGLSLSTITFAVSSHADIHFYKYIYWFQILYSISHIFFIKIHVKVLGKDFCIKLDLTVKHRSYFF